MMRRLLPFDRVSTYRRQAGDTIVEVLIAIGIISLVLTAAYVTANRSYLTMQDAQEHGNALKLLERQTEALKAYNAADTAHYNVLVNAAGGQGFCMVFASDGTPKIQPDTTTTPNPCVLGSDATTAAAGQEPAYSLHITTDSASTAHIGSGKTFLVQVKWDSILGDGQNQEQMEFGVYP